jgi:ubiquinone/menaquinone biosynthesis C-methylase UbiE
MGTLKNFVTSIHQKTQRNYLERMNNNKVECMNIAKKYGKDYWDGDRKYGYGGYKYIEDRWRPVAQSIIETYQLKSGMKILDVGCGKGFLLYEIFKINPKIQIEGFDISQYAIDNSKIEIKNFLKVKDARNFFPYKSNEFDLVISLGTLHNFKISELNQTIPEIQRVGNQGYIMLESFRNNLELFNLQCWALTCETFLDEGSWINLYKSLGYKGDYEFIYFE